MYASRRNIRRFLKSERRNTMVTSDDRPEVEIWPFRACAMTNMQYNHYLSLSVAFLLTTNCEHWYGADTTFQETYF